MSYTIREGSLAPLAEAKRRPAETWHADVFQSPVLIASNAGPVRPLATIVQEPRSRFILAYKLAELGETPEQALGDGIVEGMLRYGIVPGAIGVKPAFAQELGALAQALGISIVVPGSMPTLLSARREMTAYFKRNRGR